MDNAFLHLNRPYGPDLDWVKKTLIVFLCFIFNPSVAFAASSPSLQLLLVFLFPSMFLLILQCPSAHPSAHPSIYSSTHWSVHLCCLLSHVCCLKPALSKASGRDSQIIKSVQKLDYLSLLHKSSSRLCVSVFHMLVVGSV